MEYEQPTYQVTLDITLNNANPSQKDNNIVFNCNNEIQSMVNIIHNPYEESKIRYVSMSIRSCKYKRFPKMSVPLI